MNSMIIKNGKINFRNLVRNKISTENLFVELKKRKIENIESVKLLIVYKSMYIFKFIKDPISLIVDGKFVFSNLFNEERNLFWLKRILKKYKLNVKDIKYAVYLKNKLFIIKYNN